MRILMLSSTFPYPPSQGGTEIRTFNLLKYLQFKHDITLITQRHAEVSDDEVEELRQWVKELIVLPLSETNTGNQNNYLAKLSRFTESFLKATPANVLHRYSPKIQAIVDEYVREGKCDVITCEHSVNEIYIRPEYRDRVNTVVDVHSSVYGWVRDHLEMGASPNALRDRMYLNFILNRYERRYCSKFSNIVVTTEDDKNEFLKLRPDIDIQVIPNGVDTELFPDRGGDRGGHKLIFVGAMDASHNIDAAKFFALEVFPQIRDRYGDATFSIVGARPIPEIQELANNPGVIVTGKVASMAACLHESTVCVVPLRTGFGIKNKTLEAMSAGIPVVGSDRGLEGLAVDDGQVPLRALRANTPQEYIQAICQLFENPGLRQELSGNARQMIEMEFSWESAGRNYEKVLSDRR